MKKIKRKLKIANQNNPAYVVGFTGSDPIPPGFLAAWFDQHYGGPLSIRWPHSSGNVNFEAFHTTWGAAVTGSLPADTSLSWKERLGWDHAQAAAVYPIKPSVAGEHMEKCDLVLHVARIAKGLSVLVDGTAYDMAMGRFLNPSDWTDTRLERFNLRDHMLVEQRERLEEGKLWVFTRGLVKFGLEELEAFQSLGLPAGLLVEPLREIAEAFVRRGKGLKIGESSHFDETNRLVKVIRHRTDHSLGHPLILREVAWE